MLLLVLAGAVQGCATGPHPDVALAENRLQRVSTEMLGVISSDRRITLTVFDSLELAAYSHSDGRIFVSSALLNRLRDEELAAAIAHELGHLINDGHLHTMAALSGGGARDNTEFAADQTAAQLLSASHQDPNALQTMLEKVAADPSLSDENQKRIRNRIARLAFPANHP